METHILPVDPTELGNFVTKPSEGNDTLVEEWDIEYKEGPAFSRLQRAAQELQETDTPVAFPTETVYGLGADATRSSAVRAIFAAKGRPADNPLIVHIHSVQQLRGILAGKQAADKEAPDLIPEIYKPLIKRFWPGPLTIILPAPHGGVLAPEVTAGLDTFGARMPRSILSLALIRLAGVPLAGPSANASTRPSPTAAEHVKDDLDGRIHTIIDGGPCEVGVESTVVDGLTHPPTILRPGGITVEQLRQCPGWEDVVVGYKDKHEQDGGPRAPGMKYRHYSPKAAVFLYEAGMKAPVLEDIVGGQKVYKSVGIIRTNTWAQALGLPVRTDSKQTQAETNGISHHPLASQVRSASSQSPLSNLIRAAIQHQIPHATPYTLEVPRLPSSSQHPVCIWDIALGTATQDVARGLFSALRELDKKGVEVIFVEGIADRTGDDIAAAVMNRLRKAAEVKA